ncbi:MAG: DUF309 domain-containing protein [Ignavibacteria bacterium]
MDYHNDILDRFQNGIDKFNEGLYYECHDILEDVWFDIRGSSRRFYQGLIHLAVGFHHILKRNNLKGALSQLNKGKEKLSDYKPEFQGVELQNLLKKIQKCIDNIKMIQDGKVEDFDFLTVPKIKFNHDLFKA